MGGKKSIDPRRIEGPDPEMVAVLRAKTGAERLAIASGMVASARRMLSSALAARHPDWDEDRVAEEVARRVARGG
jgi:hypothetical protein